MAETIPPAENQAYAHARPVKNPYWKWGFRIFRWATYALAVITLLIVFHNPAPPVVQTSAAAAARVEEKLQEVEKALKNGQPATLRMDETELNSYLVSHLELEGNTRPAGQGSGAAGSGAASGDEVAQMRSNVKDVKVELIEDRVRAFVVFDVHGLDMTLQLEGKLSAQDGFLRFEPIRGQVGGWSLPQSSLEAAMEHAMESPENREKLRLPVNLSDLRIENGELVASYK